MQNLVPSAIPPPKKSSFRFKVIILIMFLVNENVCIIFAFLVKSYIFIAHWFYYVILVIYKCFNFYEYLILKKTCIN